MSGIHLWRYTLRSAAALNSVSPRIEHEGALIRLGDGFGCLHPWPELGDAPLDDQLFALRSGKRSATPIVAGSVRCAEVDGEARRQGVSLFHEEIPRSHWTVRSGDLPEAAWRLGFREAKLKVSGSEGIGLFLERFRTWHAAGFRVRLDVNESLPAGGFAEFWGALAQEEREAIDFVEDPETWTEEGWVRLRRTGIPLAVDRDAKLRWRPGDVHVVKPARFDGWPDRSANFSVTSYMDHALGQLYAAYFAVTTPGRDRMLSCGLATHHCFEPDPFFERIRTDGARLLPVGGTGLGFDDLLESLPWRRLD